MKKLIKTLAVGIGLASILSLSTVQFAAAAQVTEFNTLGTLTGPVDTRLQLLPEFAPGTYVAQLTDLQFPVAFNMLSMGISAAGAGAVGSVLLTGGDAAGEFRFDVLPNTDYFLGIIGAPGIFAPIAGLPQIQLGMFAVSVSLVPIPAAALLMSSALVGLVVVARRRRRGDDEESDSGALA